MVSDSEITEENCCTPSRTLINVKDIQGHEKPSTPRSNSGWDGKSRIDKKLESVKLDSQSDDGFSDDEKVVVGDTIEADEDLLDDYPPDTTEIDCVHSRVSSITSLRLERFKNVVRLCLRQNNITEVESLSCLANTLADLDLYDNKISHIRNLDDLHHLSSLDLSFNKIRKIKNLSNLASLTDLYFVQNKISNIENISGLSKLRNLELGGNRIRKIQGLEKLLALEELWLGKNKITEIAGLNTLHNLRILSIQSNRITNISGLEEQKGLEELYISHNGLTNLSGLEACTSLRVLEISNNKIASLKGLENLSHLQEVWASYNEIGNFAEVEHVLGDKKELVTVYFEGNPLQLNGPAVYRNKVKLALPQVLQIDASFIKLS